MKYTEMDKQRRYQPPPFSIGCKWPEVRAPSDLHGTARHEPFGAGKESCKKYQYVDRDQPDSHRRPRRLCNEVSFKLHTRIELWLMVWCSLLRKYRGKALGGILVAEPEGNCPVGRVRFRIIEEDYIAP